MVSQGARRQLLNVFNETSLNTFKQPPGVFRKKIRALLPNNKSDETDLIHPIEDGNMIANPALTFNSFFFFKSTNL